MIPCGSPLAAQIGFQVANLSKDNYKSVAEDLFELSSYGPDGTIILLRNCLEQVNLAENDQNLQVKFDLLTLVIRNLIHQPNLGTVLCEALRFLPSVSEEFLTNLCEALQLSLPEQVALGLALADAEDDNQRQQGQAFFETKVKELCENPVSDLSEDLIERIICGLYSSEALLKFRSSFLKSLPALQPFAVDSFTLIPFLKDVNKEVNTLRGFDYATKSGALISDTVLMDSGHAIDVVSLLEELGFDCTYSVDHCKEILSQGGPLLEGDVARILGTVARTAKGLEEVQNIHGPFYNILCSGEPITSKSTTWNVDILLGAINQLNSSLNWSLIVSSLDYEGFFLPDENSFTLFMTMYKLGCEDLFPLDAICSHVWKNDEGQLSFLRHAISAAPEVFSFAHSTRKLMEIEEGNLKSPNHAWLSLDLLEVLCRLAEVGHGDQVCEILEFPRIHCPELLALGLVQVNIAVSLKGSQESFQEEMLSLVLRPQFSQVHFTTEEEVVAPLWSKLWSLNSEMLKMEIVNLLDSKDLSVYGQILQVCRGLKVLHAVLNSMPSQVALKLAVFASRKGLLNLEKWLEEEVSIYRDSFASACLSFIEERHFTLDEMNGAIDHSENQQLDISATILKVLYAASGFLASEDLVNEVSRARGMKTANSLDSNVTPIEPSLQELKDIDVDKEANLYFERVYRGEVPVQNVVNMLQQFNQSPSDSREKTIFSRMISCLFDELPHLNQYPDEPLAVTAVLFGSLIKHQLISTSTLEGLKTFLLRALSNPAGSKMFSFAIQALDSFRERLGEWPEFCYHILQVPHIHEAHEAHDGIVDFIMNIAKASHTPDPSAISGDSDDPSVVALPTIVNAPTNILQDSQDEIFNSAFAAVDPAGNRFSSSQLRYPSGQGLDALLQTTSGSFSSTVGAQQPQINSQSDSQTALDSLLSSQSGLRTNSESLFQSISRAPSSQYPLSQYSSSEERSDDVITASRSEVQVKQSTDTTSLSTAAPYFPFSAAANGQTVSTTMQASSRTSSAANASGSLRTAISGFGHALNIETLVAAAGKRDKPIEAPSSEIQDKVAFIINNISWTNLEAKAKESVEVLKEEYYPWFAQYIVMKRASIEPNNHDTYIKFLDKMNSKELHKEVLKTTYENCKVLLSSNLIKTHSEERSLLKNLGSWLGKLTIRRNQALRAREIDPKSLIVRAYQKGLMIAIIPFTSKVLEPCNQSLAYQPPNPWTMGILSLLVEIYNLPNLKMNLKFDIEVLFKNLNVDMKEVKPSKLLEGLERELEGNPDFSNRDPIFSQSPSPAPSANEFAQSVPIPSLPQQLDIPTELPIVTQSATSLSSSVIAQLNEEERLSLSLERTQNGQSSSTSLQSQPSFSSSQVSMAIPDLTSYVVLNPKLAGLSQQLQLARFVPLAMERAIREIISPVVERSVTIACMTTRELVVKDYAMEADESRTNQAANLMVASLAGSLAHVTCKEPLRVAMANYLRSLMQTAISQDVLEQAVNLVTNDNLDLGCAVIEKAATEKAQRDLEEVITPVLAVRRADRIRLGSAYYDKYVYTNQNLTPLPEALRPRPGRLSSAQARVYEDFARLPWQNQPSHTPATSAGPSGITSLTAGGVYAVPSRESGATTLSLIGNQSSSVPGAASQVSDISSDELDIRESSPLSFSSTGPVGGVDGQSRLSQETTLLFPTYPNASTPPPESTVVEVTNALKGMLGTTQSSTPPLPAEHVGSAIHDPSLTTGEALDKYSLVVQKLDLALSRVSSFSSQISVDDEVRTAMNEIPEIILQCVSRDEAALAIAQKVFKRLYENTASQVHVLVHLGILESIRDVCKRVVKELTSWVVYSDEDRKFNREITVGLIRSELINLTDYNLHLTKWIDGGRNKDAVDFAAYLVKTCVIDEAGVSSTEFYNVIDALGKLAARPGSPESLQQLVEIAKGTPSKDDKGRLSKEKKLTSSRGSGLRDDGKSAMRETAAGDPPGLRDQVTHFFQEWARICNTPGGTNDKAYAIYISQLQSIGMLKGDDVTDRFFRILLELAESHCLNSETPQPTTVGEPRQQEASNLSFAAIDMVEKLVVLLVKYSSDSSNNKVNLLTKVLNVTVRLMKREHDRKAGFHPRPYFRLFVTWLMDFNSPDSTLDSSNFQILNAFAYAFLALQPLDVPGFSFAWLELISHRTFMPKLLLSNSQKGWPLFQRLLVALFRFMEPYLRNADLSEPVRLLYKGTLRVLLVLLHDFPEFLCDHHFSFCDVIPPSCIQMRNLILSAFPRNMRLPDPFTPNLKVDLLPEISQSPRILSDVEAALKTKQLKNEVDDFIKNRNQSALISMELKGRLTLSAQEALASGTRYNVPLLNALVLYVGMQAVQQLHSKTSQQLAALTAPITHSAPMDIFQRLVNDLDTEGRYLFLNAVANQLRYPNNHTYYFSCVLLFLFAEASAEIIQEQITRVLLERLIVNRPHPWGLLITFIELIKNPRYSFWTHTFTRCAPEIDKLFESVARSCMTPTLKPTDDDLAGSLPADSLKG